MVHALTLQVAARDVEDFSEALWRLPGLLGIQECPLDAGAAGFFEVNEDFEFLEFGSEAAEKCADWLESDAYRGQGDLLLRVHLDNDELTDLTRLREAVRALDTGKRFEILSLTPVVDVDYLEEYKKSVRGQLFTGDDGRPLWIGPPWDTPPVSAQAFFVEPGLAFGTGDHPTTQMCLASLDRLRASGSHPASLVDIGTGSGVLAAAARRFFPACRITATDLDPLCRGEVEKTFALNQLDVTSIEGRYGADGDTRLIRGPFDVVVSNIYAEVLLKLLPDIAQLTVPGGLWIVSGVLNAGPCAELVAAAQARGFRLERRESKRLERPKLGRGEGLTRIVDEWFGLEFRRA